jgi:thymidylate synthase (FAD)
LKVSLVSNAGTDLTVVNSARVSFDKESEWDTREYKDNVSKLFDSDRKLIRYLATHKHFTPFTHCTITLRETVPLFVARQRFKHTIGFSYNEMSRRYVDSVPELYSPKVWRGKPIKSKQGSSDTVIDISKPNKSLLNEYEKALKYSVRTYKHLLSLGVCPEQARMVLPQSMYTSYYVTGSLYAFARAYNLRSSPDAQSEIRDLAKEWDTIISKLFPYSWSCLTKGEN